MRQSLITVALLVLVAIAWTLRGLLMRMQTFVSPRVLSRQVRLHPLIISLSVIGGGILLGPAGAILALPAAAMARTLLDELLPRRYGSEPASGVTTTLS